MNASTESDANWPYSRSVKRAAAPHRVAALFLALIGLTPLVIAGRLAPSEGGIGTHRQLGLPECGWVVGYGIACPTCGMTTAFTHAVAGQWLSAFNAQPAGALLALACAAGALIGFWIFMTGCRLAAWIRAAWRPVATWSAVALFLIAWAYKILVTVIQ